MAGADAFDRDHLRQSATKFRRQKLADPSVGDGIVRRVIALSVRMFEVGAFERNFSHDLSRQVPAIAAGL